MGRLSKFNTENEDPRGYNGVTMKHDIAIAFVKKPFKFSSTVKRIKLAPGNQKIKGT